MVLLVLVESIRRQKSSEGFMADQEDKKVLDIVEAQDKDAANLIEQLEQSLGNVKFPIDDANELVNAMGGPNTKVQVGGKDATIRSLAAKIPAYYFPIADEHELIAKLADLSLQHRSPAPGSAAATKLMDAKGPKPNHKPPSITDDEHKKSVADHKGLNIGGHKKKP
jgi:hypothetical protein